MVRFLNNKAVRTGLLAIGNFFLIFTLYSCEMNSIKDPPSIYESPLSVNSNCRTSYYIIFDEAGNAISKVTYKYDENGRISAIDTDGTIQSYEYDENGKYNCRIQFEDSDFYAVEYSADTIKEYQVVSNSTNPDSLYISYARLYTNLNASGQPENYTWFGGCCTVLATVKNEFGPNGNLIKQNNTLGIYKLLESDYDYDLQLKYPFPVPDIYEKHINAITYSKEIWVVPNYETLYEYKAGDGKVIVYTHIIERNNIDSEIESETEYKKFEIYFECM